MFNQKRASPRRPVGDPYARLGLSRGATTAAVKHAYRRLAKRYHPDRAGEVAMATFLEIQAAYKWIVANPLSPASGLPDRFTRAGGTARQPIRYARQAQFTRNVSWVPRENTGWPGARWYWEGLKANAGRRSPVTSNAPARSML